MFAHFTLMTYAEGLTNRSSYLTSCLHLTGHIIRPTSSPANTNHSLWSSLPFLILVLSFAKHSSTEGSDSDMCLLCVDVVITAKIYGFNTNIYIFFLKSSGIGWHTTNKEGSSKQWKKIVSKVLYLIWIIYIWIQKHNVNYNNVCHDH